MASATTYEIRLRYLLEDRASRELAQMTREAQRASRATGLLSMGFGKLAALGGGALGLNAARKALIGFNSEAEQAQLVTAGSLALNMRTTVEEQLKSARYLASEFQQIAKDSVGETSEFVAMAQLIARPVTRATKDMRELRDITSGATIAAKAFRFEAEVAALDIENALQGNLTSRDRFARSILEPMGYTTEAFNELGDKARFDVLLQALRSPQLKELANLQGKSFEGTLSTLQDSVAITLGAVGRPLFAEITAEIQRWNRYLDANGDKISDMAKSLAGALVDGFSFIKEVAGWMVENRETLMAVAKGLIAFKAGQALVGIGRSVGGGLGAASEFMKTLATGGTGLRDFVGASGSATSNLALFGGILGKAVPVLGGLVAAGTALHGLWSQQNQAARLERAEAMRRTGESYRNAGRLASARAEQKRFAEIEQGRFNPALGDTAPVAGRELTPLEAIKKKQADIQVATLSGSQAEFDQSLAQYLLDKQVLTEKLDVDNLKLQKLRDQANLGIKDLEAFYGAVADLQSRLGASGIRDLLGAQQAEAAPTSQIPAVDLGSVMKAPKVNVTINRIEVQSDDPDRFVFQMVDSFKDLARSPGSALNAFREG